MHRIGLGVIGAGQMGTLFARIFGGLPEANLLGVADLRHDRVQALCEELNVSGYTSYDQLLEEPGLEAVVIATSDSFHLEPALAAAQAGKHLFIEKPLATSVDDAQAIVRAAEQRNLTLLVGHVLRFDPGYSRAREALKSGQIGDVVHLYARHNTSRSDGLRLAGRTSITYYLAVHDIDAAQWLLGSPIVSVFSRGVRKAMTEFGVDDTVLSMLKFSTGAIGILETSWLRPDGPSAPTAVVMEVMGTQGMIELIPFASSVSVYTMNRVQPDNQAYVFVPGAHGRIPGMYREEASHFLECIATGRRPICTGRDALSAVVIADAIERSVATNSEIQVETGS